MWGKLTAGAYAALAALLSAPVVAAAAEDPGASSVMTLERALEQTLARNPQLLAFGYQLDIQQGRIRQAELGPAPELLLEVENFAGGGDYSGFDSTEVTLGISWVLERGKRERRAAVARTGLSALQADADIGRLDAAASTAHSYLECLQYQALIELAGDAVALARQTVEVARRQVNTGRAPDADLARAEASLAAAELELDAYQHDLLTARHRLAAQWGDSRPAFDRVAGDPYVTPALLPYDQFLARLQGNPELERLLSESRLRQSELELAEARSRSDWRFALGVRHFEADSDQALVAGFSVPVGSARRNAARVAESHAALAETEANRSAARVAIELRLFAAYQAVLHELHIAKSYRATILPRTEQVLETTERAYETGRYSYLELSVARDSVLTARTSALRAAINAHRNLIEIERLTGMAVGAAAAEQTP